MPGWKEIDEEYTVVKQRPVKVQKEVWVKKLVEVEEMQPYTVKRTRKKKVPVEKLKEVEEWQEVDVTTDQAVTVNGYRVDEVEDRKVVQVKEEQKYELVPRLLTERRILSARYVLRMPSTAAHATLSTAARLTGLTRVCVRSVAGRWALMSTSRT